MLLPIPYLRSVCSHVTSLIITFRPSRRRHSMFAYRDKRNRQSGHLTRCSGKYQKCMRHKNTYPSRRALLHGTSAGIAVSYDVLEASHTLQLSSTSLFTTGLFSFRTIANMLAHDAPTALRLKAHFICGHTIRREVSEPEVSASTSYRSCSLTSGSGRPRSMSKIPRSRVPFLDCAPGRFGTCTTTVLVRTHASVLKLWQTLLEASLPKSI